MSPAAVANIQARIAEIESRIGVQSVQRPRVAQTGTSSESALAAALGASDDLGTTFGAASNGGATGNAVIEEAKKYLGTPYKWGGNDINGIDCSALVQQAFRKLGIELPRVAADQARQGTKVPSLAQAKPGDLVAFGSPVDHIGIYVGDNKMIVAPRKGDVVKIQEVYKTPTAIRRIIPDNAFSAAGISGVASGAIRGPLSSQYNNLFIQAGNKHGISPNLLAAVAKQESGFNPRAVSSAGAQGLMQIMPGTARGLGVNALDPTQAVDGAARMLSGLVDKFGSVELALAGYNAGPGAVQKYNGIPPYKETQNYVRKVLSLVNQGGGL